MMNERGLFISTDDNKITDRMSRKLITDYYKIGCTDKVKCVLFINILCN